MKLNKDFITHDTNGEQIMVDVAGKFSGLVKSNSTAAFIVDCLKKETTIEEIVDVMYEKYDAPKEVIEKDVRGVIDQLRKIGAIDE